MELLNAPIILDVGCMMAIKLDPDWESSSHIGFQSNSINSNMFNMITTIYSVTQNSVTCCQIVRHWSFKSLFKTLLVYSGHKRTLIGKQMLKQIKKCLECWRLAEWMSETSKLKSL